MAVNVEKVHMVRIFGIKISLGLLDVDCFLQRAIEEGSDDIHLIDLLVSMSGYME